MKLCEICKAEITDKAFASVHNICRACLESGQDIECLNHKDGCLSDWEQEHIKQCKNCGKNFVQLWYATSVCSECYKYFQIRFQNIKHIKEEKAKVVQLGKKLRVEISGIKDIRKRYIRCQQIIQRFERAIEKSISIKEAKKQKIISRRIKKHFGSRVPFDVETLCRVIVDRSPYNLGSSYYDRVYEYFVEGRKLSDYEEGSIRICCCTAYHPNMSWLFKPIKRRPKEVKLQELNDRIADITEAQSRIDLTETKE